jgi:methionyl-tRNA formyltransferase
MIVSVLCTDVAHPVYSDLEKWVVRKRADGHTAFLCSAKTDLVGGDILFLVSCSQIISASDRQKFSKVLVLHASDLPKDRGWSPHIWRIVEGAKELTVSLIEAQDSVDTGDIWFQEKISLVGTELLPEINRKLFSLELALMDRAMYQFNSVSPTPQRCDEGSYRRKRGPDDSRLDPYKSIAEQFDLLRVVDNQRYPAFFEYRGERYTLLITKADRGM